jgi:hypothetical protein
LIVVSEGRTNRFKKINFFLFLFTRFDSANGFGKTGMFCFNDALVDLIKS